MAGTVAGGKRAAQTNKERYGEDFYKLQGSRGGRATGKKGFAINPELARKAGSVGGKKSKRTAGERKYEYKGGMFTARTIAEKEGVLPSTIRQRYEKTGKVTIDEA